MFVEAFCNSTFGFSFFGVAVNFDGSSNKSSFACRSKCLVQFVVYVLHVKQLLPCHNGKSRKVG